jgi:hypothetical protein
MDGKKGKQFHSAYELAKPYFFNNSPPVLWAKANEMAVAMIRSRGVLPVFSVLSERSRV